MPSSTLDDLVEAYARVSASNQRMLRSFALLATALQSNDIEFVVLKGADLLSRLYRIQGLRHFCDIDLLVYAQDLPRLDQLLTGLGFQPEIDGNPSYYSPEQGLRLDISTSIWYLDPDGMRAMWDRTIQRKIETNLIRCMSANDLLLYLTAYNILHRGSCSTGFAQDIRLLLEQESIDWTSIQNDALRWNLAVPLYYGLVTASGQEPISVPSHVFTRLAPSSMTGRVLLHALRRLVTPEPLTHIGHFLLFLTRPGMEKLRWLWRAVTPPPEFLRYRYGETGATHPLLTRFARVGSLLVHTSVLASRILFRLCIRTSPSDRLHPHRQPPTPLKSHC